MVAFINQDPPHTLRAWVACLEGKPEGIAGYYLPGGPPIVFSQINEPLRPYRKFIVRFARDFMEVVPKPVFAIASTKERESERFLRYLGFQWTTTDEEGEVYEWRTH